MSIELSSRPERPAGYLPADPWIGQPENGHVPAIRRQATEIIAAVLSDSTPQQARARAQLRRCLEVYPGRPEVALTAHLIALREEAVPGRLSDQLLGQEEAAGAEAPTRPSGAGLGPSAPHQSVRRPILHQRPTLRVLYGRPARKGSAGPVKDGS